MSDVKGLEISDVLGLSQPLTKLIETVSGGIGKIYEPTHIKRMAKAKSEEIKMISSSVADNITLPVVYTNGEVSINSKDFNELIQRTQERFLFQEVTKQNNIDSVVAKAYEELEQEETVSEIPVDIDWTSRFFDSVANVSNEDMQDIWAKILAGEIKRPGSFSLRTLEIVKNVTKKEAEAFQKICEIVLKLRNDYFIVSEADIYKKYSIEFSDILLLDECGLIISNGTLSYNMKIPALQDSTISSEGYVLKIHNKLDIETKISYGVYTLTNVGKQLFDVVKSSVNENYVCDVAEYIQKNNSSKINISIHNITVSSPDFVFYTTEPLKEYKS